MMRTPDDLDELLERDRRDEIRDLQEFTEEDLAFLQELREMMEEFN
jgi:hypothetical protein